MYFHDRVLTEAYIAKLTPAEPTSPSASQEPSSTMSSALLGFESEFLEMARLAGGDCRSACKALASLRPRLGSALGNAVRGLIQARGAVAHPVASDMPMRVLREVRETLFEHGDHVLADSSGTSDGSGSTMSSRTAVAPRTAPAVVRDVLREHTTSFFSLDAECEKCD